MSGAAEVRGVVRRIAGGRALVAVAETACGGCTHAGGCAAGRLAAARGPRLLTLPADAALAVGDAVCIRQCERGLALSAVLGYLVPALAMPLGAWGGAAFAGSDAGAAAGAAGGFVAALAAARLLLSAFPALSPPPRALPLRLPLSQPATPSAEEYPDEP
ncbi:SoxR reducing system RseC family protein [Azospira restricta]|uniref:SoxR reducing system RseC family protein n=1 Tax=Azospira restricta TaxID=404405 RepID=A0A974SRA7_9RHOO|nr:SoxR reducing system RseC family protein [Azospira restricta]QRJ65006.1 SoxR reducing system RseC family protein [Azospira restricta]